MITIGRTLPTFRYALESELASWKLYRRGLRESDRPYFDLICDFSMKHADSGSLVSRPIVSEVIFFSSLIEQQKQIIALENKIKELEKKLGKEEKGEEEEEEEEKEEKEDV